MAFQPRNLELRKNLNKLALPIKKKDLLGIHLWESETMDRQTCIIIFNICLWIIQYMNTVKAIILTIFLAIILGFGITLQAIESSPNKDGCHWWDSSGPLLPNMMQKVHFTVCFKQNLIDGLACATECLDYTDCQSSYGNYCVQTKACTLGIIFIVIGGLGILFLLYTAIAQRLSRERIKKNSLLARQSEVIQE